MPAPLPCLPGHDGPRGLLALLADPGYAAMTAAAPHGDSNPAARAMAAADYAQEWLSPEGWAVYRATAGRPHAGNFGVAYRDYRGQSGRGRVWLLLQHRGYCPVSYLGVATNPAFFGGLLPDPRAAKAAVDREYARPGCDRRWVGDWQAPDLDPEPS